MSDRTPPYYSIPVGSDDRFQPRGAFADQETHNNHMALIPRSDERAQVQRSSRSRQQRTGSIVRSRTSSAQQESSTDQTLSDERTHRQSRGDLNIGRHETFGATGGAAMFNNASPTVVPVGNANFERHPLITNDKQNPESVRKSLEKKLCKPKTRIELDLPMFDQPLHIDVDSTSILAELREGLLEQWPILRSDRLSFFRDNGQLIDPRDEIHTFGNLALHANVLKMRYDPPI